MPRFRPLILAIALTAACSGQGSQPAPEPAEHALSGLAAQHIAVLPTYVARVAQELHWNVGRPLELQRTMDADIVSALDERGLRKVWIFPEDLSASYRRNSTYATDPYQLAEEPLRSPSLMVDARLPEPLASQIRTLVALRDDVRYVLAPVELRLETAGHKSGEGRGVLRLVLVDARASNVRWIGEIPSETVDGYGPSITAGIAAKLANVISPR
jgi:hypothetical protein